MDSEKIKNHLFSLTNRGIKYDLNRMRIGAEKLGRPQNAYPSFHVAGTNGKGSTCAYLESSLRHLGYRTGLYTSPHLINFEERFMIDGQPILEKEWIDVYWSIKQIIDQQNYTFFEATTLMAFELFKRKQVDWAIFEVGLGGRLDATNIISPKVSIIARIAMDHMDYLGSTLESIAREKLGIAKPNVPLIMAQPTEPQIAELARSYCIENNSPLTFVDVSNVKHSVKNGYTSFELCNEKYELGLPGTHQILNASLAIEALKQANLFDHKQVSEGLSKTTIPGRFQISKANNRTFVFDVGHNPNASQVLVEALQQRFPNKSICFVTGIMKDKDYAAVLESYCKVASHIILTRPDTDRAATPEDLLKAIPQSYANSKEIASNVNLAIDKAMSTSYDIICITGSFFTVGEAMQMISRLAANK